MKRMRKIESPKVSQLLFLLCWFAYFTSYIGRLNYSSAMTAMIQEAVLTKSQAGFISMVYFFAYGIGQFCNGLLGDRFHPGKMIFSGLAIAAGANLCMGFVSGFGAMAVVWGINGVRFYERYGICGNSGIHVFDRCSGGTKGLERDDRKLGGDDIPGTGGVHAGEERNFCNRRNIPEKNEK